MAIDPVTQPATAAPGAAADAPHERAPAAGMGPWQLAWRRLRRNRVALAFGALFVVLVLVALSDPIYANEIAKTTPERKRVADEIVVDG